MKPSIYLTLTCLLGISPLFAQDDTIRVTTTLRADGSRVDKKVDPAAKEVIETVYDTKEKVTQTLKYRINDNGDPVEGVAYDAAGKPLMKVSYKHDGSNRVSEQIESTPEDKVIRRLVYKYDNMGKLAGVDTYDADGVLLKKK